MPSPILLNKKKYTRSIALKIVITCLFAGSTIFLSLYISKITFKKILGTVDQLSKPNNKIELVNDIFRDAVQLDQLLRMEVYKNAHEGQDLFPKEYGALQHMLDSLRAMSAQNPVHVMRIDSMKEILRQKKLLFSSYIQLRTSLIKNDTLAKQVKQLSGLIEKAGRRLDSNMVTTSRKTEVVIDTIKNEDAKHSLWRRIFPKKKQQTDQVQKKIHEELRTRVDTMALSRGGDSVAAIGRAISQVEQNRVARRNLMISRSVALNEVNDALLKQMISILDDIEADERAHVAQQNNEATRLVNTGMDSISLILLFFTIGTAVLIYMIFTDIVQSNNYRNQLIAAKEEAEEAGRVKQRFLANMSHELRTPLQAIIGISQQMKLRQDSSPRELENIYRSSQHLLHTVNEILDYSRIVSGKYSLDNELFSVAAVVREVEEIIQVHTGMKRLELYCQLNIAADGYYLGDAFRLKQILLNLLGNAVKFTDTGSISLTVDSALQNGHDLLTFTIKDTGIGIAEADIKKIFNQFEQVSNPYKQQGTGLGLNIVKALVELQQGDIKVSSSPGDGSVFVISIPYQRAEAPMASAEQDTYDIQEFTGHVWVVDDDEFILQLCDDILTKYDIAHTCFSTATDALTAPVPEALDVVFLDIRMPGMSGTDLCRLLKVRMAPNPPKFIALTAQVLPQEQETMLGKGFDALLLKPFIEESFIAAATGTRPKPRQAHRHTTGTGMLHQMTGDDKALLKKSTDTFIRETEKDIRIIKEHMSSDRQQLAEPLHRLAGRCGQFGAKDLARQLRTMELDIRTNGVSEDITAQIPHIYNELDQLIASMQSA